MVALSQRTEVSMKTASILQFWECLSKRSSLKQIFVPFPTIPSAKVQVFEPGATIIREGDLADELFFLCQGKVDVGRLGEKMRTLAEPTYFGEIAMLGATPRSASVVAASDVVVITISRDEFERAVRAKSELGDVILSLAIDRLEHDESIVANRLLQSIQEARLKGGWASPKPKPAVLPPQLCTVIDNPCRIVATVGPATFDRIENVVGSGGFVRFNMAFIRGIADVLFRQDNMKRIRKNAGNKLGILLDAVGPRVKLGQLPADGITLTDGDHWIISIDEKEYPEATKGGVSTIFKELPQFVKPGHRIILAEGRYEMKVHSVDEKAGRVDCLVHRGGLLKKRGINLPDTELGVPALSDEDKRWLKAFLIDDPVQIDMVALSFVRDVPDIKYLREFLDKECSRPDVRIMAKIETQQAVDNIDAIAANCDSLMVARGDLWAEIQDPWSLPRITVKIIRAGNRVGIPVVTATQVASSMQYNAIPTRAEVDELFFLVEKGTDCIMGSEEFSAGKFPDETVAAFRNVAEQVWMDKRENQALKKDTAPPCDREGHEFVPITFAGEAGPSDFHQRLAAIRWAESSSRVSCLIVVSESGTTARALYRERPNKPLIVITNDPRTARYLQLMQVIVVLMEGIEVRGTDVNSREIAMKALYCMGWASNHEEEFSVASSSGRNLQVPSAQPPDRTAILVSNEKISDGMNVFKVEELPYASRLDHKEKDTI